MATEGNTAELFQAWPTTGATPLTDDDLVDVYATTSQHPTLWVNFISSVDGAVTVDGLSAGLGLAADRRVFDLLRKLSDAVMVGAGTLRQEGYGPIRLDAIESAWRIMREMPAHPALVIVTRGKGIDPSHRIFTEAPVIPIVLTHGQNADNAVAEFSQVADVVIAGDESIDFNAAKVLLSAKGFNRILCEGGPSLLGALTAADAIDEMCLTVSPVLAGAGAGRITSGPPSVPRQLELMHALAGGNGVFLRYGRNA